MPGEVLAANDYHAPIELQTDWDEPDALADIAFAAGILGLLAGLIAVGRLTGTRFPDPLFWRALPLLLTVPPAVFVAALCSPGGLLDRGAAGRARAAGLALGGVLSYVGPLACLSIVALLAGWR